MKQIIQNLNTGETTLEKVSLPQVKPGHVLIETSRSLVSAGTERMLIEFGKAGWLEKARQKPDKVKQALDKMPTDGLIPTVEAVLNKLDEPMPLGYCNAGVVIEVGYGVTDLQSGDCVASNGAHAEVVCVPTLTHFRSYRFWVIFRLFLPISGQSSPAVIVAGTFR